MKRIRIETSSGESLEGRVIPASAMDLADIETWDRLCRQTRHLSSPFLTPHYTRAVATVRPAVRVCIITRDRAPVGFLPFQYRSHTHRILRAGERVGEEMTDYFGLVAQHDVQLNHQDVLRLSALQSLSFTHLDETQQQHGLFGEKPEAGYLTNLDQSESYWERLRRTHKKFVTNTERGQRQVEAEFGPLRFTPMQNSWQDPLQTLIEYKGKQYRESGRENIFEIAWKRRLMEVLAACNENSCTGMLSTLYAGDVWLASHFGLRSTDTLHYWFPVYNPDLSPFGPGRLLLKCLIEWATDVGFRTIDYGAGDALYKQQCSNGKHTYFRGTWHRSGFRSFISRTAEATRWRLEKFRPPSIARLRG